MCCDCRCARSRASCRRDPCPVPSCAGAPRWRSSPRGYPGNGPQPPPRESRLAGVKVLVTGASGFLGAAVCARLVERGHTVSALARRPGSVPADVEELKGDLADGEGLRTALAAARPEAVVHLAAEIASQRDEAKIREVNVHGTARLVEACGTVDSPKFVFASTVVTGEAGGEVLTEDSELPVETPYGRSKQEGEKLVRPPGLPSAVIRPGHAYGPGGWYEHEFVRRLRQPGRFAVIGSGDNWWDGVHVDAVAGGFVQALEQAP